LIYPALLLLGSYSTRARWWLLLISVKAHHTDYSSSSSSSKLPSFLLCHADADLLDSFAYAERFFSSLSLSGSSLLSRFTVGLFAHRLQSGQAGLKEKKKTAIDTQEKIEDVYIYSNQQIGNRIPSRFRERAHSADDDDSTQSAGKEKKKKSSSSLYISEGHAESKKNIFFVAFATSFDV
jgi:hypothetical protein